MLSAQTFNEITMDSAGSTNDYARGYQVYVSNDGTTWSSVSAIPSITAAARPQMAVFGSTIYIVYINTDNGTASLPVGSSAR